MEHDSYAIIIQLYLPPCPLYQKHLHHRQMLSEKKKTIPFLVFFFSDIKTPQKQGQGQKYISLGRGHTNYNILWAKKWCKWKSGSRQFL